MVKHRSNNFKRMVNKEKVEEFFKVEKYKFPKIKAIFELNKFRSDIALFSLCFIFLIFFLVYNRMVLFKEVKIICPTEIR